jgi:DNA polymerase-3 subunit gamma/tau
MLSTAAFNALLKTLEEPPPHVKFIFATTEANKILPTIISRCQRFDLRRIPLTIIANHLLHIAKEEGVDLDEKAAYAIGKGADGGMRDAQSMMDQLVAFCGNHIREQDVLEIFGFTSVQTVAQLVQNILESDTVGALQLVHDTSEAGKDLGKLLSDLIQHLRTVLVSQADPEAGAEDLEPDIAQMVTNQCQMASTEQLLRVVDGLAEVDARMRWATNKRLHLELGVIQAVQHFNEVSLSDVIEALDSGSTEGLPKPAPRPVVTARAAAPVKAAPSVVAEPAPVYNRAPEPKAEPAPWAEAEPTPEPQPAPAPVAASEPKPEPAPVAAPAPAPVAAPVAVAQAKPEPAATPAPAAAPSNIDKEQFWTDFTAIVQERRALVVSWVKLGTVLSIARGTIKVGFPTTEEHAKDSLNRDNQKKFLEGIAEEILGSPVKFDFVIDASLAPPLASEIGFGLFDEPAPKPTPSPEPKPEPAKADSKPAEAAAGGDDSPSDLPVEVQADPLIMAAVEKFRLKLAARG